VDEGGGALAEVTVGVVESILDPIRPAIAAMSGQVKVLSAVDGVVTLGYRCVCHARHSDNAGSHSQPRDSGGAIAKRRACCDLMSALVLGRNCRPHTASYPLITGVFATGAVHRH
jgi:hypothetical protein